MPCHAMPYRCTFHSYQAHVCTLRQVLSPTPAPAFALPGSGLLSVTSSTIQNIKHLKLNGITLHLLGTCTMSNVPLLEIAEGALHTRHAGSLLLQRVTTISGTGTLRNLGSVAFDTVADVVTMSVPASGTGRWSLKNTLLATAAVLLEGATTIGTWHARPPASVRADVWCVWPSPCVSGCHFFVALGSHPLAPKRDT